MAAGMTLFCIAVVFSYFSCATALRIWGCKLNFSNALMGYP